MKRLFGTLAFVAALALAGCGKVTASANSPEKTTEAVTTEAPTEPTTSEDKMKLIGDRASGESVFVFKLDNKTGKDIKSFSIKADTETDYPANMISESDPYTNTQRRMLYYVPVRTSDVSYGDTDEVALQGYTIRMEFTDGKAAELHQIPFTDIDQAEILMDGEVAYLDYISKATNKKVSTKEAEKMIAETAAQQTATEAPSEISQSYDEPVYTQPQYDEPVYTQPTYVEPTTVYVEPTTVYVAPTEAPTAAGADDPNGGCIGNGGLFNE